MKRRIENEKYLENRKF